MNEGRDGEGERAVDQRLLRSIGDAVRAAYDVRDAVPCVVDRVAEDIERPPVGPEDDEILDVPASLFHPAKDQVFEDNRLVRLTGDLEAYNVRLTSVEPLRNLLVLQSSASAVVHECGLPRFRVFPLRVELFFCAEAAVRVPRLEQCMRRLDVLGHGLALEVGPFVPIQAEPLQSGEYAVDRFGGGAFHVGVFDAQNENAAGLSGPEPIVQSGARSAEMEIAGRAGSETHANG